MPSSHKASRNEAGSDMSVEAMEPRVLLSADAFGVDASVLDRDAPHQLDWDLKSAANWWEPQPVDLSLSDTASSAATSIDTNTLRAPDLSGLSMESASQEHDSLLASDILSSIDDRQTLYRSIVFLDTNVIDGEQLLSDILQNENTTSTQIYLIDSATNGVGQITAALEAHHDLDSVHIISHGNVGQIQLGSGTLSSNNVESYSEQLNDWGNALSESGDILIYGCDLASDGQGQALVDVISVLTGADVAASVDQTGNVKHSGDWDLEYQMGAVETAALASYGTQSWTGTLALINVTTFEDLVDGGDTSSIANLKLNPGSDGISLREAVIAANNDTGQADTITLSAGTYSLAIAGTGENFSARGDLDILDPLTITGAGAGQTIIDGGGLDRVFEVNAGSAFNISISDLSIQNGVIPNAGAGIFIGDAPAAHVVTLSNVWLSDNHTTGSSGSGGAIYNRGDLTITDSLIEGNSAHDGGGVMNFNGTLNMTNVTLSGNTTTGGDGGGLFNASTATLLNVTVAANSADSNGGGLHSLLGATTNINNTLVADNSASNNPDVDGAFVSDTGDNLIEVVGTASGFHGGDLLGATADIGALSDNGGTSLTHALLNGSAAINSGSTSGAPIADQRGYTRIDAIDIGAYEFAAGPIIVDTTSDLVDGNTTSVWALVDDKGADGFISLREAILAVNEGAGGDTISLGSGTYTFAAGPAGEDAASTGDLDILTDVSIVGANAAATTIDADGFDRVFHVLAGGSLNLSGVTLTGGATSTGAGISNSGKLTITDSALTVNNASGAGGAIYTTSGSDTMVERTEISQNTADQGAGIYADASSPTLTNVTLSSNTALDGGGAIYTRSGNVTVINSTIADNNGTTDGSGIKTFSGGTATLQNTLLKNVGDNLTGTIVSLGYNVDTDTTSELTHPTDQFNVSVNMGALSINGGQTRTHALLGGTATTIDPVGLTGAPTFDQRGVVRDATPDIGAFESNTNNNNPTFISNGPYSVDEGAIATTIVGKIDADDGDGGAVDAGITYAITSNVDPDADGNKAFAIDPNTGQITVNDPEDLDYEGTTPLVVTIQAHDGTFTSNEDVTVNLNDVTPSLTAAGAASTHVGQAYELNLMATEPGSSGITSYTVNWGDGTVTTETYTGSTTSVSHVYDNPGYTYHITVAANDLNGTLTESDLIVSSWITSSDEIFVFDGASGDSVGLLDPTGGDLSQPYGVAIGPDGNFYVAGYDSNNIVSFTADGAYIGIFNAHSQLDEPAGLAWGSDGNLYVGNHGGNNILRIDAAGTFIDVWGDGGTLDGPEGIAFSPEGDLYVSTSGSHEVVMFDGATGGAATTVIDSGLDDPEQIAFDADGNLYIANTNADEVLLWDGVALSSYFTHADLEYASGVVFGPDGQLYVSSYNNDSILRYDGVTGEVFVSEGAAGLDKPAFLAFTPDHRVTVELNNAPTATDLSSVTLYDEDIASISLVDIVVSDVDSNEIITAKLTLADTTTGSLSTNDGATYAVGTGVWTISDSVENVNTALANLVFLPSADNDLDTTINVNIDDGDEDVSGALTGTVNLNVTPQNDEQLLATNTSLVINEGSTDTDIITSLLETTDVDNTATQLVYTVTALPSNGFLNLSGTPLALNNTFTQDDIDNNRITYDHDGSETTSDSFNFSVDDGAGAASTSTFNITVNAQNDEQSIALNTGTSVAEHSTGNLIDNALLDTTDVDNTAAQLVYTVTALPVNGSLLLGGTPLGVNNTFTQDDIDNNRITYDHNGSETTSDSFNFSVDDGAGAASTGTFNITVNAQNDEQSIALNTVAIVAEHSIGNLIDSALLTTTDVDNAAAQLVYTVTALPGNGSLNLSSTPLGLNNTFTQDEIDNNRITYDHNGSETTSDSFNFSVDDGAGTASTGAFNITVNAQNDEQSIAFNTGTSVAEHSTGNLIDDALLNTTDVDNTAAQLVYTVTALPGNGFLNLSSTPLALNNTFTQDDIDNNRITYDHDGSETTSDSFNFSVDDGAGATSTGTFNITVNAQNDEQSIALNTGTSVAEHSTDNLIDSALLTTTDVDNAAAQLVYTVTALPSNGSLNLSGTPLVVNNTFTQDDIDNNRITYDHDGSETTSDSFNFSVDDGAGAASTGTFNITVNAQNDEQSILVNTAAVVAEHSSGNLIDSALLDTTDVDNTAPQLMYTVTALPGNGFLNLSGTPLGLNNTFTQDDIDNNRITYDHDGSETTSDSFNFSVDDGAGAASTGTFNIIVNAQNDEQSIALNTAAVVAEHSTGNLIDNALLDTTDVDNTAAQLVYTVTALPGNGFLNLSGTPLALNNTFTQDDIDNNSITYDHNGTETTSDSFNFSVDDGASAVSTGTFNITVNAQNDEQSILVNTAAVVAEHSTGNLVDNALLNTTDVDNTAAQLVYTVTALPGNGSLNLDGTPLMVNNAFTQDDIDNNRITYDHDGSETTSDSFNFSVDDGAGAASTSTFNITVNAQNDEQSIALNTGTSVAEHSTGNLIDNALLDTTDVDNTAAQLVYTVTALPGNGFLLLGGTPLVVNNTFTQDDIDNNRITYDHNGSETTSDSFNFSVDDGAGAASTGTFNITVNAQNDEQSITLNTGTSVAEHSTDNLIDSALLTTTDVDNTAAQLVYTVTALPGNGFLNLSGTPLALNNTFTQDDIDNNRITYDHDGSETTSDSFNFSVDDGAGAASTGTFNIAVNAQNDEQSILVNTAAVVAEHSTGNLVDNALLNTTDVDNTATQLVYTVTALPGNGSLLLGGTPLALNNTFTQDDIDNDRIMYDHNGSETTSDSFNFSVDDGAGAASTGTFNITVNAQNDEQSIALNTAAVVAEHSTGNLIDNALLDTTDVDNTATQLVYTVTALPGNGSLNLSGTPLVVNNTFTQDDIDNNRITYDHNGSETTDDSFNFSVDDGAGAASTGTFNITVNAQNDEQSIALNTGTSVAEHSTGNLIDNALLNTTDVDNTAAQLVYTVTALPGNGSLNLSGTPLMVNNAFTQDDIDNNRITYDHDGSETTSDSFNFSVDDGAGAASTGTFNITVNAQNDEQSIALNTGTSVAEHSTDNLIDSALLTTTDVDNAAAQLVYTVTALPSNGSLNLSGTPLALNNTFTQDDIDNNRITYDHDGSETTDDSFNFSVDDGAGAASTGAFNITVIAQNDRPTIQNPIADQRATEGIAFTFQIPEDTFSDVDTDDNLVYTVLQSNGEELPSWLRFDPLSRTLSGTAQDADIGSLNIRVLAVDNGMATVFSDFNLVVIEVNDSPILTENRMALSSGDTVVITNEILSYEDIDSEDEVLFFTLTDVNGGQFFLTSDMDSSISTFTHNQLSAGKIVFIDDGDEIAPSYSVSVSDGFSSLGPSAAIVSFTPESSQLAASLPAEETSSAPIAEFPVANLPIVSATSTQMVPPTQSMVNTDNSSDAVAPEEITSAVDTSLLVDEIQSDPPNTDNSSPSSTITARENTSTNAPVLTDQLSLFNMLLQRVVAPEVLEAPFDLNQLSVEIGLMLASNDFNESLDRMRRDIDSSSLTERVVVGSGVAVTTGLSVGYVAWMVRGGVLLSSVLSSLPAWQFIDPLPILNHTSDGVKGSDKDDSLEEIITEQRANSDIDESATTDNNEASRSAAQRRKSG